MQFLNWCGEHYLLTFFGLMTIASCCHGLGRLGSTTTVIKQEKSR